MPGFNCFVNAKGMDSIQLRVNSFLSKHSEYYRNIHTAQSELTNHIVMINSSHPGYRMLDFKTKEWMVFLETQQKDVPIEKFKNLLEKLNINDLSSITLKSWRSYLSSLLTDCFFLLAVHLDSETVVFANDDLARLPAYIAHHERAFFIGREIGLAKSFCQSLFVNPLYLALYQVFCYIPGRGSFYNEVDTLPGASIGVYSLQTGDAIIHSEMHLRFPEINSEGDKRRRLAELSTKFEEVIRRYRDYNRIVLALSGGYDSRVIAGALTRQNVSYEAATYMDVAQTAGDDSRIANQIADILKCPHKTMSLSNENEVQFKQLFHLKSGINYLGMAFFMQFLDALLNEYSDSAVLITGDGGDKVLPCLLPVSDLSDESAFLDYLYKHQAHFDPRVAAETFGLSKKSLDDHILNLVCSYPGKSFSIKYKEFLLAERAGRWLFEGEDRNRYHLCSVTPFYDFEFYRMAMQIPDAWKHDYSFYSMFLKRVSPQLGKIRLANSSIVPGYVSYSIYRALIKQYRKYVSSRKLRQSNQTVAQTFPMQEWIIDKIKTENLNSNTLRNTFSSGRIDNHDYLKQLNITQLKIMLTLVSVVDEKIWQ